MNPHHVHGLPEMLIAARWGALFTGCALFVLLVGFIETQLRCAVRNGAPYYFWRAGAGLAFNSLVAMETHLIAVRLIDKSPYSLRSPFLMLVFALAASSFFAIVKHERKAGCAACRGCK